jgi:thiol-disulfide isomerase/thioredoxin
MKRKIIYLVLFFMAFSTSLSAKTRLVDTINIKVHLKANKMLRLRFLNEYLIEQVLTFKNTSLSDSTLSKKIASKKPLEFRYSVMTPDKNDMKNHYYNFILSPGDEINLELQESFDITCLNHDRELVFANKELNLYNVFDQKENDNIIKIISSGVKKYDAYLNRVYVDNLNRLDSIFKLNLVSNQTEKLWRNLIITNYYNLSFYPLLMNDSFVNLKTSFKQKVLDSKGKIDSLQLVNSYALKGIFTGLIKYEILSLGKNTSDLNFYTQFMINSDWEKEVISGFLIERFDAYPEKRSIVFQKSFEDYKNFFKKYGGKDETPAILSAKYFPSPEIYNKIILVDIFGNQTTLSECLKKGKGKIIFIDLWASWCKPCRFELPFLEKIIKKTPAQHVEFISISLDKNSATKDWMTAMKQENLGKLNQYRLLDASNPALNKAFQVEAIPRYLIFDRNGNILNDDFLRPSSEEFQSQLLNYVKF